MSERPLLSVITPTWRRHELLLECVENVQAQTYPNLEHIIVSDGPDPDLDHVLWARGHRPSDTFRSTRLRLFELGRNWSTFLKDSYCAAPVMVGQMLARGEYHCIWSDDERALPHHLTAMVDLLESSGADFVYPVVQFYRNGQPPEHGYQIGSDPPQHGQITHWLSRASMLDKAKGPYRTHVGLANDWEFVSRSMAGGATWAMLPELTFSHRADH